MSEVVPAMTASRQKELLKTIAGLTGMCNSFADRMEAALVNMNCTPEEQAFNNTDPKMIERLKLLKAALDCVSELVS